MICLIEQRCSKEKLMKLARITGLLTSECNRFFRRKRKKFMKYRLPVKGKTLEPCIRPSNRSEAVRLSINLIKDGNGNLLVEPD
jgi:hypothetical protein